MRNVPSYISERLKKNVQTRATDSDPSARIWISRPSTALVDDRFLERQTVLQSNITDVSVAVCHPKVGRSNTEIFMAYISDGVAKVVSAKHKLHIDQHIWIDCGFEESATSVCAAFDGTMPKSYGSEVEFVTDSVPWVFWINSGALYAKKLYSDETIILAESNCTDVSAIRAMWSNSNGDDYGFIVFFILDGTIHYRQLIDGEWMDAEVVSFGPSDVTWSEIAAFRTWDYRVGLQCKSYSGDIYELFTQFMGVAKHGTEHINVDIDVNSKFGGIKYSDRKSKDEHIGLSVTTRSEMTYGLSSVPVKVQNVDNGTGDYGSIVHITMDYPVHAVEGNYTNFTLVDDNAVSYICTDATVDESGLVIELTFMDFNMAEGLNMTLTYTPGTIQSIATSLAAFSVEFTPENLEAPDIPVPEPVNAWAMNSDGTKIALEFSEAITGTVDENAGKFVVENREYEMIPGDKLVEFEKSVVDVKVHSVAEETVDLSAGSANGLYSYGSMLILEVL